jgi:hypothetical protein
MAKNKIEQNMEGKFEGIVNLSTEFVTKTNDGTKNIDGIKYLKAR